VLPPFACSTSTHDPSLPGAKVHGAPSFVHDDGGSLDVDCDRAHPSKTIVTASQRIAQLRSQM